MNLAFLTYSFLFDPADTWQQLSQFEQDLNSYLNDRGMEAKIISPIGGATNKIIYLTKKKEIESPAMPQEKMIKGNTGFAIRAKGKQKLDRGM